MTELLPGIITTLLISFATYGACGTTTGAPWASECAGWLGCVLGLSALCGQCGPYIGGAHSTVSECARLSRTLNPHSRTVESISTGGARL